MAQPFNPNEEDARFLDWVRAIYGFWVEASVQAKLWFYQDPMNIPEYAEWVNAGKPDVAEQRQAQLEAEETPSEQYTRLGGIYPVSKYPQPPVPAPEGMEWQRSQWSGTTLLDEESWVLAQAGTPPREGGDVIRSMNGWDVLGHYDENGNFLIDQALGQTPKDVPTGTMGRPLPAGAAGMTAYQQAQINLQRQSQLAEAKAHPRNWIEAWMLEHAPMGPAGPGGVGGGMGRDQIKFAWENVNPNDVVIADTVEEAQALGAKSWIPTSVWQSVSTSPPGKEGAFTARGKGAVKQTQSSQIPSPYTKWMDILSDPNIADTPHHYLAGIPEAEREQTARSLALSEYEKGSLIGDYGGIVGKGTGIGSEWTINAGKPQMPPTPAWLPQFVPGLQAGRPLTKKRTDVASGQLWGRTPWSQREMLGGYLEFTSGKGGAPTLRDYQEMVQSMLPRGRERQARWKPATQK